MWKTVIALFIIAHGLVHSGLAAAPNPDSPGSKPGTIFTASERSWLLPKLGLTDTAVQWVGILLVALSTVGFVIAGLGILGGAGVSAIWRIAAVTASILSIFLLGSFWHRWFPVGLLIDIAILLCLLWFKWRLPL